MKELLKKYKYGFSTDIETNAFDVGLNEDVIKKISQKKNEPDFVLDFRLKAFEEWKKMKEPVWGNIEYDNIDYQKISYYSEPKNKKNLKVDKNLLETLRKLKIPLGEQQELSKIAVDVVFDSTSLGTSFNKKLKEKGVILCSISEAFQKYPEIVEQYLGSVVSYKDNFFAALNSAVFSDGSFVYIPKGVKCPIELSTYFRINDKKIGQFERTLIIAEENSSVSYLEGCSAPSYDNNQLHAAVNVKNFY